MKARGKTRIILKKIGEVQGLIGMAMGNHQNDVDPDGFRLAQEQLQKAFDLCVEIREMYDPA